MTAYTDDSFLDGTIVVRQPAHGFRSGLDAVMLAASIPAGENEELLELGAGAGVATLCVSRHRPGCRIVGVEIEESLAQLANENARANRLEMRASFTAADALNLPDQLRRSFDHVFCNPPFHSGDGANLPPDPSRARALHDAGRFRGWLEAGVRRTCSDGTFTAIIRADRLSEALAVLPESGLVIFPLWARANSAAKRVIVQLRKNARSPLSLLPGLVLHTEDGHYTDAAEAVLRGGASLALAGSRR